MARPLTGRRLHRPAFDELLRIRGLTCAELASQTLISESLISDMRAGRRLLSPPNARAIAELLDLRSPEAILWPVAAEVAA